VGAAANRGPESGITSARKVNANRANSRASTGPRTPAGKARAARNAPRHGLCLPVMADSVLAAEVKALAQEIAGEGANFKLQQLATRIAEAQIDLVRIRRARQALLSRALSDTPEQGTTIEVFQEAVDGLAQRMGSDEPMPRRLSKALVADLVEQEDVITCLADCADRLDAMDRYERRAMSRRKFAIREFDAARQP
jgi:hypothetical protein